jgi:hypothetical protein
VTQPDKYLLGRGEAEKARLKRQIADLAPDSDAQFEKIGIVGAAVAGMALARLARRPEGWPECSGQPSSNLSAHARLCASDTCNRRQEGPRHVGSSPVRNGSRSNFRSWRKCDLDVGCPAAPGA